jgi:arsenate reductase-like glutaredoxin family protein
MDKWILFGKSGNPSFEVTKAWLKNHAIPVEIRSVYEITEEEIETLSRITNRGARDLAYPDAFSYALINPQRASDQTLIEQIQSPTLSESEIKNLLFQNPHLVVSPILTNFDTFIVGYHYEKMVNTFRFVKVRDPLMA